MRTGLFKRRESWSFSKKHPMIQLIFFVLGIVTFFYLFINFFTSLNESHDPPFTEAKLSTDDMNTFLHTLSYAINEDIYPGSPITVIHDGPALLEDMKKEIAGAHEYIYVANYLWQDGTFSDEIFAALTKKARTGVRVRVLIDGVGGIKVDNKNVKELEDAGGKVAFFRPIKWWNIDRWDRRNHMRDIVIDGRIGYVGGIAFTDEWLHADPAVNTWHDYMFKMDGKMSKRLESVFTNLWAQTTGELLPSKDSTQKDNDTNERFILLFSKPSPDTSSDMEHLMWMSIMAATNTIYIENPYILPSKSIKNALIEKAKQGVDIRIIDPYYTDAKHVKWASQSYYSELLDAGIKIYEYKTSRIHAKTMVVDQKWSIIGSANLDNRSSRINLELLVGTEDKELATSLGKIFQDDLSRSEEITKDAWSKHSIYMTPVRLFSRLFVRQY